MESSAPSTYGPVRPITRRVAGKDGPLSLYRPPAMKHDDFVDAMKEVIPELVEQAIMSESARSSGIKRPLADVEHGSSEASNASEPSSSRARVHEVLSV